MKFKHKHLIHNFKPLFLEQITWYRQKDMFLFDFVFWWK